MNLVKIIILSLILTFGTSKILYAESHDTTKSSQTITSEEINIEEINEEINIETDTDEEDVPLNDPFAGNAGASATTSISQTATEEQRDKMNNMMTI